MTNFHVFFFYYHNLKQLLDRRSLIQSENSGIPKVIKHQDRNIISNFSTLVHKTKDVNMWLIYEERKKKVSIEKGLG